jgi:hypothetical protein
MSDARGAGASTDVTDLREFVGQRVAKYFGAAGVRQLYTGKVMSCQLTEDVLPAMEGAPPVDHRLWRVDYDDGESEFYPTEELRKIIRSKGKRNGASAGVAGASGSAGGDGPAPAPPRGARPNAAGGKGTHTTRASRLRAAALACSQQACAHPWLCALG